MSIDWRHRFVSTITRLYPFYTGCGMLANSELLKVIAPPSPDLVWAQSMAGEIKVSLDDHVGRALYFFGDLDPKISWVIKRILRPGDLAFDIGANFGILTLLMSKL